MIKQNWLRQYDARLYSLQIQPPGPAIPALINFCRLASPPMSEKTLTVADVTSVRAGRGSLGKGRDVLVASQKKKKKIGKVGG